MSRPSADQSYLLVGPLHRLRRVTPPINLIHDWFSPSDWGVACRVPNQYLECGRIRSADIHTKNWWLRQYLFPEQDEPCLFQQLCSDAEPFPIERFTTDGLACPAVPVRCVAFITFLAMQVCVHPRTIRPFVLLGRFVGTCPVAFGVPPESSESVGESRWRGGLAEWVAEFVQIHGSAFRVGAGHPASILAIIRSAHWMLAAMTRSVRGLPCGVPNRSSAVRICIAVRIAAMIPITRFRPSSMTPT